MNQTDGRPEFSAEAYSELTGGEQSAFAIAHDPSVARALRDIEALEPTWRLDGAPYPPRFGRYWPDEPIFGWSIPRATGFYLHSLILAIGAVRGLEVGTSFGYSTIWLASALAKNGGQLISCEIFEEKRKISQRFIDRSGLKNVEIIPGDAAAFMKKTEETFDFVFLDADATEYSGYLPWLRKSISFNGLLAMDNALTHGEMVGEFVNKIQRDPHWASWLWPYDHGLMLARRRSPAT